MALLLKTRKGKVTEMSKISKQMKYILIAAGCVVVLLAALLIVMNLPDKEPEDLGTPSETRYLLGTVPEDVTAVSITNSNGTLTILPDGESYTLESYEQLPLKTSMLSSLFSAASRSTINQDVENSGSSGDYGLDAPQMKVELTLGDGSKKTYSVGNQTPVGSYYYAQVEGEQEVYIITSSISSLLTANPLELVELELIPAIDDASLNNITRLAIGGAQRGEEIEIVKSDENYKKKTSLIYHVSKPEELELNSNYISGALESLPGLQADAAALLKPSEQQKADYGFAEPSYTLALDYEDPESGEKSTYELTFGNSDGTNIYVMRPGVDIIYQVALASVSSVSAPLDDIVSKFIALRYIDTVQSLTVDANGKKNTFELSGTLDDTKVSLNGKELDIDEFRSLYSDAIGFTYNEKQEPVEGEPILTITYAYRDGDPDETVEFIEVDARKCYVRFNGQDTGWNVLKKNVDNYISQYEEYLASIAE